MSKLKGSYALLDGSEMNNAAFKKLLLEFDTVEIILIYHSTERMMTAFEQHLRQKKGIEDGTPSPKPIQQKVKRTEVSLMMVGRCHRSLFDEDKLWSHVIHGILRKGQGPGNRLLNH